jgi:hypothetical protein
VSQDKAASKRKRRRALPVLGATGLALTLASGASAAIDQPTAGMTARHAPPAQEITLAEEDISSVSLATFHVFDKENAAQRRRGSRWAWAAVGVAPAAAAAGPERITRRRCSVTVMLSRIRSSRADIPARRSARRVNSLETMSRRERHHRPPAEACADSGFNATPKWRSTTERMFS